jgi:hypothetical protein
MRKLSRALVAGLLGAGAALLVSCSGSGKGLIPPANAGPLKDDFEAIAQAAQSGQGNCASTEAAIVKAEGDLAELPATVDRGLRARLHEGLTKLREDALGLCARTTTPSTTTTAPTTTSASTMTAPPAPAVPTAGGALCIGDSVLLGASPSYMGTLTMCGRVDATESRQMSDGPAVVRSHAPYPSTVIIHLGTNGTVNGADVDAMMHALGAVPTVVLTTVQLNGGRSWQGQANGEIRATVGRWPNARLADWEAASAGHPEYFSGDGIHLGPTGAQPYANTLAAAL